MCAFVEGLNGDGAAHFVVLAPVDPFVAPDLALNEGVAKERAAAVFSFSTDLRADVVALTDGFSDAANDEEGAAEGAASEHARNDVEHDRCGCRVVIWVCRSFRCGCGI